MTSVDIETDTISGTLIPPVRPEYFYPLVFSPDCYLAPVETFDELGNWTWNYTGVCEMTAASWGPIHYTIDYVIGDDVYRGYQLFSWWATPPTYLTVNGFYQPVDMDGVYNLARNGSTVPFKFELFDGDTEVTDPAWIESFTQAEISCEPGAIADAIETTATGNTSLRYDPSVGQFIYNWKTPRTPGACYLVTMTVSDGSMLEAYFKLK